MLAGALLAVAATCVAGYGTSVLPDGDLLALAACAGIAGMGTSLVLMRFGFLCTHVGLRDSLASTAGAALVGVGIYFVVIALPDALAIALTALLPLGAAFLLVLPEYEPFPGAKLAQGAKVVDPAAARHQFNKLVAAAAAVSFFGGLGKGLSVYEFSNGLFEFSGVIATIVVGVFSVVILAALGGSRDRNPAGKLYVGIMVFTIFLLFLACFDVGITHINGCKEVLWIFFSCLFAYAAFRFDFKPMRTFAFGEGAYLLASALGWGAGALLALQHFSFGLRVVTSLVIMFSFVVVLAFVFGKRDVEAMTDDALLTERDGADDVVAEGAAVAGDGAETVDAPSTAGALFSVEAAYGLSSRETEIVLLYVQGRSANWIADDLAITSNTVHTHLRNAYTKLGVHNRQQLRSLLEQTDR